MRTACLGAQPFALDHYNECGVPCDYIANVTVVCRLAFGLRTTLKLFVTLPDFVTDGSLSLPKSPLCWPGQTAYLTVTQAD